MTNIDYKNIESYGISKGDVVKLRTNPNQVEILFIVEDIYIYVRGMNVKAMCIIRPIKRYETPDGGYYGTNSSSEHNVLDLIFVSDDLQYAKEKNNPI